MRKVKAVQVYVWDIVERERGWGMSVDGHIASESRDVGENYIKTQYASRSKTGSVPDYYVSYEYAGYKLVDAKRLKPSNTVKGLYYID